ncbi:hypothetical protein ACHAXA_008063 [Cyclostephanos tholiformis]|uniref:Uncharacterized protein n=1 Tax=Cyclostephanos tholiformis TaxID=382380 RepID=A0ABD3RHF6_9STRA
MVRGMKFYIKRLIYAVATSALQFPGVWYADAVAGSDNINGVYTVFAGKQYANSTCSFLCSGPNWGTNGQFSWSVKVTFGQSAASYIGATGTCFANNPIEYYDWNKLWGKARCGYAHSHQTDSDRFVWRRLQNFSNPANCGNVPNCSGIQLATYSYDAGTTPYPNENWDLSKTFSTILQPDVAYILGMESFSNGTVLHSLRSHDGTLLESKINIHTNLCMNYEQGTVLGLYFGGSCTAPQSISVLYAAVAGPTVSPSKGPNISPASTGTPTAPPSSPTLGPVTPRPTTRKPTRKPTRKKSI